MLELDIIVSGPASPPGISAFPHGLAIKDRLRLVQIDLCNAASASSTVQLRFLVIEVFIGKLD